jgi:hypothetical protein
MTGWAPARGHPKALTQTLIFLDALDERSLIKTKDESGSDDPSSTGRR